MEHDTRFRIDNKATYHHELVVATGLVFRDLNRNLKRVRTRRFRILSVQIGCKRRLVLGAFKDAYVEGRAVDFACVRTFERIEILSTSSGW